MGERVKGVRVEELRGTLSVIRVFVKRGKVEWLNGENGYS